MAAELFIRIYLWALIVVKLISAETHQSITMSEELTWAIKNGDLQLVKDILDKDNSLLNSKEHNGRPPLCMAADYGQDEVISALLNRGADINEADKYGITPLLAAIFENHPSSVQLLLEKGADKSGKAPDGKSYLESAESDDIKLLLQK